jgi:ribonuclease J
MEVLKRIIDDKGIKLKNKIKVMSPGRRFDVSDNIKCELINVTHSTLQTVIIVLFTKYGNVVYANDFKLDKNPTLGPETNYALLKGLKNVKVLVMDCLYAERRTKAESESVARDMLRDVLLNNETKGKAIFVTTFSSHLARLTSIVECGKKLNRKVVFLGRSLGRYIDAAEATKLVKFKKIAELVTYPRQIMRKLREIEKNGRGKYLIVCTGHQGEPRSVLSKIINGMYHFEFLPGDFIVFSSKVIPTEACIRNRKIMEDKLKEFKVKIFRDIHQSGHLFGEDMIEFINLIKPENIVPCQGEKEKLNNLCKLGEEIGFIKEKTVHLLKNGDILKIM